jgi:hypothetical protein
MYIRYGRVGLLMLLVWFLGALNGCVGELYQSIKADLDLSLDPQTRERLNTNPRLIAIHSPPETSLSVEGGVSRHDPFRLEDPLLTVKDRFLTTLSEQMHLTNVQAMPAPRLHSSQMQYGVSIRELVRLYDHGLVLDFQTLQWAFTPYGENKLSQWSDWNMSTSTILFHRVRARLIDLDQRKLLWQTTCYVHTQQHSMQEWLSNQSQLVKDERQDLGFRCARQLVEKLAGT